MKECRLCGRTMYGPGESICAVCLARHDFEDVREKFRQGKVSPEIYTYYLDKFNALLNKRG